MHRRQIIAESASNELIEPDLVEGKKEFGEESDNDEKLRRELFSLLMKNSSAIRCLSMNQGPCDICGDIIHATLRCGMLVDDGEISLHLVERMRQIVLKLKMGTYSESDRLIAIKDNIRVESKSYINGTDAFCGATVSTEASIAETSSGSVTRKKGFVLPSEGDFCDAVEFNERALQKIDSSLVTIRGMTNNIAEGQQQMQRDQESRHQMIRQGICSEAAKSETRHAQIVEGQSKSNKDVEQVIDRTGQLMKGQAKSSMDLQQLLRAQAESKEDTKEVIALLQTLVLHNENKEKRKMSARAKIMMKKINNYN